MTIRTRLAVAFVLVSGVVSGALAVGSYLLVAHERESESVSSALQQVRANLAIVPTAATRDGLMASYSAIGGFSTAGVYRNTRFSSSPFVPGVAQAPAGLAAGRSPTWGRTTIAGIPYLVVAVRDEHGPGGAPISLFFFFSEQQLQGDLDQLRYVLAGGWLAAILLAGMAGVAAARRTLRPVGRAGDTARAIAEGALDARIRARGRDEFGRFAVTFNEMADALQTKIDDLDVARARERRFTADVAHELRTPLTALVGEAELLLAEADSMGDEGRRLAGLLAGDVSRLRRLVGDLIEVSQLDAATEPLRIEQIDLEPMLAGMIRAHGWSDRVRVDGGLTISTDRRRIERIVANLVGNAVEHTAGPVAVRLEREGDAASVCVDDGGPGIPPEHLPHVFERFYKADSARSGGGSGLGLAIASEHAAALGGAIEVHSLPETGSRFTLRLPVAEPLHDGCRLAAEPLDTGIHVESPV